MLRWDSLVALLKLSSARILNRTMDKCRDVGDLQRRLKRTFGQWQCVCQSGWPMSRAASGQHPLPLDFYHTFVLHLPCFHHTSTTFLPYFYHASTMLQPYFYHASAGVYLLGNQWCSPWSLVSDLPSSGFSSPPKGSQCHSSFNADGETNTWKGELKNKWYELFHLLPVPFPM